MARPTKATAPTLAAIVEHVRGGLRIAAAAAREGVTPPDLSHWRRAAEQGRQPFATFFNDVARAEADFEASMLTSIRTQATQRGDDPAQEDWKARAWLLERTRPAEYAPSQTLVVKARGEAVAQIMEALQAGLTPAAFAEVVSVLGADDADDEHQDDATTH